MVRCLEEAMPKILETTTDVLKPKQQALKDCATLLADVDTAIASVTEKEIRIEGREDRLAAKCDEQQQDILNRIKTTKNEAFALSVKDILDSFSTAQVIGFCFLLFETGLRTSLEHRKQQYIKV